MDCTILPDMGLFCPSYNTLKPSVIINRQRRVIFLLKTKYYRFILGYFVLVTFINVQRM